MRGLVPWKSREKSLLEMPSVASRMPSNALFLVLLLFLFSVVFAHIEDVNPEIKPSTIRPFLIPDVDVYDEDEEKPLQPMPAEVFIGRSKRRVHDPVADFLDEQAASAIFADSKTGPSGPPIDYNALKEKSVHSSVAGFETPAPPAPPGPPSPPPPPPVPSPSSPSAHFTNSYDKVIPPSSTRLIPFDLHVDSDFPIEAPRARGLVGIPEGWNTEKKVDYEFKAGYRWNNIPTGNPSKRNYDLSPRVLSRRMYRRRVLRI